MSQIKAAVDTLHSKYHISHGDLHQDNILVNRAGKVWVIDFGRAQLLKGRNENSMYSNRRYVFNYNGVPTYSFKGMLARKNKNMLKRLRQ